MAIAGIILCILLAMSAATFMVRRHRSDRAAITTIRNLASIADTENHAYLHGDGRTGNTLADARIRLFEALTGAEKPTDDAILNAVAVLEDPASTVGKLADAVKYLNTGELTVPVRANEGWHDYCHRVESEKTTRESVAQRHERIASGIAADNKHEWRGRNSGIKFDMDAPIFMPSGNRGRTTSPDSFAPNSPYVIDTQIGHALTDQMARHMWSNDTLIADHATGTVSFAKPSAFSVRSAARLAVTQQSAIQ